MIRSTDFDAAGALILVWSLGRGRSARQQTEPEQRKNGTDQTENETNEEAWTEEGGFGSGLSFHKRVLLEGGTGRPKVCYLSRTATVVTRYDEKLASARTS